MQDTMCKILVAIVTDLLIDLVQLIEQHCLLDPSHEGHVQWLH